MPRRDTSPQNAPASEVAAATRRALHTPKLAFLAASLPKLRAWGLETLEADARLKRLTAPGVVQLEAAMVEMARDPATGVRLRALAAEPVGSTREELAETIRAQDAGWGPVARAAGVTAD